MTSPKASIIRRIHQEEMPSNQSTAPAIVYSLALSANWIRKVLLPSFPRTITFLMMRRLSEISISACTAAAFLPDMVVLLGIPPDAPEVEYGWIEPGIRLDGPAPTSLFAVDRFWEKPHQMLASALMARGCLWNTFIMIGRVSAFLNLIRHTLPDLLESFESVRSSLLTVFERKAARDLYSGLHATGFSRDVLSARPNDLAVLRASGLGWSDMGKPSRVLSVLERQDSLADKCLGPVTEIAGYWSANRRRTIN